MLVLYLLAVVGVVIAVDLLVVIIYLWTSFSELAVEPVVPGLAAVLSSVPAKVYVAGALGTLLVIAGASLVQTWKLGEGGAAVAAMMGARRLKPNAEDLLERRLLNIVEEMSIASGVRMPGVFVMDQERGINAFAAGNTVSNAAVVVTRGTLESLNRDELQGVVGHEFSHILNGDMQLNIRMLGILAGIVFIGSIGRFLLRSLRSSDNKGAGAIAGAGLALLIVGSIGLFFARLIKASVSRQREYLADASSVQFTRNPDGIAGALDQIRQSSRSSLIENRYAEEMAHMFFGQGITVWFGGLFNTHPALEERITRIHPRFQPSGYRSRRRAPADIDAQLAAPVAAVAGTAGFAPEGAVPIKVEGRSADLGVAWGRSAGESVALVGSVTPDKVDQARRLIASLPPGLHEKLHESESAFAAVIALLLAPRDSVMEEQLAAARAAGVERLADAAGAAAHDLRSLGAAYHLAVLDIALPAMKAAQPERQAEFFKALEAVIHADRRVSLNEFALLTLLRSQLSPQEGNAKRRPAPRYKSLGEVRAEALLLVALCAHAGVRAGATAAADAQNAFQAGAREMSFTDAAMPSRDALKLQEVGAALERLRDLAPLPKAVLIKALFAAVTADGTVRIIEAALMRMVGAVLDCPLPPLLQDLDPASLSE